MGTKIKNFDKNKSANWDKLFDFMDKNNFSCSDFMACVCAHIGDYPQIEYNTELAVKNKKFKITIIKENF